MPWAWRDNFFAYWDMVEGLEMMAEGAALQAFALSQFHKIVSREAQYRAPSRRYLQAHN